MIRRNYFITDEFGDMWNEEPLPTFKQANEWRNFIKPLLNSPRTLTVVSKVRCSQVVETMALKRETLERSSKKEYAENSDF